MPRARGAAALSLRLAGAAFILGVLVGAALATLHLGGRVDRLTLDNAILLDEVERLAGALASREHALTQQRRAPVQSVRIEVTSPIHEHVRFHIEQRAHELLRPLVGEEVERLNPALIESALTRRVEVEGEAYTLSPTLIVLGREVFIRLEARPVPEGGRSQGPSA